MALRINTLPTHWQASDAELIIDFLDELRDILCEAYGEEIREMHRLEIAQETQMNIERSNAVFDDDIEL